jgi:hypothetical protein
MNRKKLGVSAAVLFGVFLAGFLPEYVRANRLEQRLEATRPAQQLCLARSILGMTFLQTSMQNYGKARDFAASFFEQARSMTGQPPEVDQTLKHILSQRDEVIARLARADPSSYGLVQHLYQSLLQISGKAGT